MDIEPHVVFRLLAAAGLGAAVGIEREASDQAAGLRTHMSVAIGAALFGVVSTLGFEEFETDDPSNVRVDVTRVASTVVTGIGFLGAGIIFRRGSVVHNLTTAASLWVVAAIGLSCGVGDLGPALVATGALLLGLLVLRPPRQWIRERLTRRTESVRIELTAGTAEAPAVDALRAIEGLSVKGLSLEKQDGALILAVAIEAEPGIDIRAAVGQLSRRPDVVSLSVGE